MIITCKECSTRFRLDESLLRPDGSKVRCSRCSHIFTAFPPPVDEPVIDLSDTAVPAGDDPTPDTAPPAPEDFGEPFGFDMEDNEEDFMDFPLEDETSGEGETQDQDVALEAEKVTLEAQAADEEESESVAFTHDPDLLWDDEEDDNDLFAEFAFDEDEDEELPPFDDAPTPFPGMDAPEDALEDEEPPGSSDWPEEDELPEIEEERPAPLDDLDMDEFPAKPAFTFEDTPVEDEDSQTDPELWDDTDPVDTFSFPDMDDGPKTIGEPPPRFNDDLEAAISDLETPDNEEADTDIPEVEAEAAEEEDAPTQENDFSDYDAVLADDAPVEEIPESLDTSDLELPEEDEELPPLEMETDPDPTDPDFSDYDEVLEPAALEQPAAEETDDLSDYDLPPELETPREDDAAPDGYPPVDSGDTFEEPPHETGLQSPEPRTRPRSNSSSLVKIMASLFFILAAAYVVNLVGNLGLPVLSDIRIPMVEYLLKKDNPPAQPTVKAPEPRPDQKSVVGRFITNESTGDLFVITGQVENPSRVHYNRIQVKGTLLKEGKIPAMTQMAYCGNLIPEDMLKSGNIADINDQLTLSQGGVPQAHAAPGETVPFMLVFSDLPDDLQNFTVEVAEFEKGSEN